MSDPRRNMDRRRQFALILERGDALQCRYCGVDVHSWSLQPPRGGSRPVHIEHLTPLSRGGTNDLANLGLSCGPCNLDKRTRTEDEYLTSLAKPRLTVDDLAEAREHGRHVREETVRAAPIEPIHRIAWLQGYGVADELEQAVKEARAVGVTWTLIARALGENHNTVRVRYTQPDRYQRYKARRETS